MKVNMKEKYVYGNSRKELLTCEPISLNKRQIEEYFENYSIVIPSKFKDTLR